MTLLLQDDMTSLPMLSVPHDAFRHGLGTLKDDIGNTHVVEAIQRNVRSFFFVKKCPRYQSHLYYVQQQVNA